MKAVVFDTFGGPEVLHVAELPEPEPGPGKVLVEVAASSVNPTDIMMRNGMQAAGMTHLKPPYISGIEFSGRIRAVGAGVDLAPGTPVVGVLNPRAERGGAYAQRIVVSAKSVGPVGEGVDLVAATTVPMNALTAEMALDLTGLEAGDSLLVTGAAGLMGGYTVTLAKARGLIVVANTSEADAEAVRDFGANHIVPRDAGRDEAVRALFPQGVGGLIDAALIGNEISHLVRDGGVAVSLRSSYEIKDPRLTYTFVSVTNGVEDSTTITAIGRMITEGTLKPRVAPDGIFTFEQAAEAHRMAERGGFRGRVVIAFT